jgi:hypothetical protein
MTLPDRFWEKVDASGDCWEWTAGRNGHGYGAAYWEGRQVMAHRLSWTVLVGDIPEGMTLDHLCRNRVCVNPAHLEIVTLGVNSLRGFSPPALLARATHCAKGHPFSDHRNSRGWRECRVCTLARHRRQSAKRKFARAA